MLGECKITEKRLSFSLRINHKDGWGPIEAKAQKIGKEPWMQVNVEGRLLAVVDWEWFNAARQVYERYGGRFPD